MILSISVILWHTILLCYGFRAEGWFWYGPLRPLCYFLVPGFFALSGFLVAGSLERNDLLAFATLRVVRIYPALIWEVLLSAFVIGPIFTTLDPGSYFGGAQFHAYLLNMLGWVHYVLPGVFVGTSGTDHVNDQLWTVPFELESYVLLALLAACGLVRRARWFAMACIALTLAISAYVLLHANGQLDGRPPGKMIVLCFIFGVALFLLRHRIKASLGLALVSCALYGVLIYSPAGVYLASPFVAYVTVYLGVQDVRLPLVRRLSDYSYGLYLYGFPIQQIVSALFPAYRVWWFNFPVSLMLSLIVAGLSWHLMEKRINANKRRIVACVLAARDRLFPLSRARTVGAD